MHSHADAEYLAGTEVPVSELGVVKELVERLQSLS
jgi:hypothetical protein